MQREKTRTHTLQATSPSPSPSLLCRSWRGERGQHTRPLHTSLPRHAQSLPPLFSSLPACSTSCSSTSLPSPSSYLGTSAKCSSALLCCSHAAAACCSSASEKAPDLSTSNLTILFEDAASHLTNGWSPRKVCISVTFQTYLRRCRQAPVQQLQHTQALSPTHRQLLIPIVSVGRFHNPTRQPFGFSLRRGARTLPVPDSPPELHWC